MSLIVEIERQLAKHREVLPVPEQCAGSPVGEEADPLGPIAEVKRHFVISTDTPDAPDYISYLEGELFRYRELSARSQRALLAIQASHGWKILLAYYKLRNILLPRNSRRHSLTRSLFNSALWWGKACLGLRRPSQFRSINEGYQRWIRMNEPGPRELAEQRDHIFTSRPRISIIVPTWNTPRAQFQAMIQSVLEQTYDNWELCIADGGSSDATFRKVLRRLAAQDARIRLTLLPGNRGISGNTNAALALATGEYVALLDHDDRLAPFALFEIVQALNNSPEADFLYSDEDVIDESGRRRSDPHFKPDWSPETLRSHNYICHLAVLKRDLVERVGRFRSEFDGSQDYDLFLRVSEQAKKIVHIPRVLYHWRRHDRSTVGDDTGKMYAYESARKALQDHLRRLNLPGQIKIGNVLGTYQATYRLNQKPLVSIIIPTRDQRTVLARCLESVARSSYDNYEILLVENHSEEPETFAYYREVGRSPKVRLLTWDREFNYAAVNNYAVGEARGDVLLFLNNDTQVINNDWLERMLEHIQRPEVGAVGAKLYYPDNTVQHAGVVLGIGGIAGHVHRSFPRESPGYCHRMVVTQNVSVVTGACLMMRKRVFQDVGGFDDRFILAFNDVDLCIRLRQRNYDVIWTPHAELFHFESKTRGHDDTPEKIHRFEYEINWFLRKWGTLLESGDPFYNRNLTLQREDFSLKL